jgi:mannose-6-phosphate isomerase-like protein (cupin superfamily)
MFFPTSLLISSLLASPILALPSFSSLFSRTDLSSLTLYQKLVLAPGAIDRIHLLSDADLLFSFNDTSAHPAGSPGVATGLGGQLVRADRTTFPALYSMSGSMALGFLGPCGFNTPHLHPRANELFLVIKGRLHAETVTENNGRRIVNEVGELQMTVFPMGSVHMQFNPDCEEARFVASFTGEDPGVAQIAQEFFGFQKEVVNAAAGGPVAVDGKDVDVFRDEIPDNVVLGVESCLKKCGIDKS